MSEHTPGPWAVYEDDCVFGADGYPVASADGKADIQRGHGEAMANARLIAAAPDLLEACNLVETAARRFADGSDRSATYVLKICDKARTAIAKAEGRDGE